MTGASRTLVGLMSGTSLDGISAAVVRFTDSPTGRPRAELLAFRGMPYDDQRRSRLARAIDGVSPEEYCRLNFDLGGWFADAAVAVLAEAGVPRSEISAVASHGQTLWHVPQHSTWQCGESAVIAERTGIDVIDDFRVRDVAAGGHGAPLVAIADALLFADDREWRALQNLGGIGNVTVVPPGGDTTATRAFDTGPGVVIIDGVVRRLTSARIDDAGVLSKQGRAIEAAVRRAMEHPYFAAPPPKSTGRELFTPQFIDRFVADCQSIQPSATSGDIIATAVALTAESIAHAFRRFIPEPVSEVIISGGGAENPTLSDAIATRLAPRAVRRFGDVFFDGEAKEAVAFALLGYLFLERRAGNVPSVTGAHGPRVLGKLTPA